MTPLDVAAVIAEFNVGPLEGKRLVRQKVNGQWTTTSETPLIWNVIALHPTDKPTDWKGHQSDRPEHMIRAYAPTEIRLGDLISWDSAWWRVYEAPDYSAQAGAWMARAARIPPAANP